MLDNGETMMLAPVAPPGSQVYEPAPLAVNTVLSPAQMLLLPVTVRLVKGMTLKQLVAELLQPDGAVP
jgi:hypothetical protein